MTATEAAPKGARPAWRAVALPSEHGGWGLTAEPVLLGLLVAPSAAGVAIGFAALAAFLVRTPLKAVLVDRWRRRRTPRARMAVRIAAVELVVLALLVGIAGRWAGWSWLLPVALAMPLFVTELAFDMRSRGRRLVPELCGAIGIAAVAAAVVLAGGASTRLAIGLWLVLGARAVASIPFVRAQVLRLRHGSAPTAPSDLAQIVAVAVAGAAVLVDAQLVGGFGAVVLLALTQAAGIRRPPPATAKVLGFRQMGLGLLLVSLTAAGVRL